MDNSDSSFEEQSNLDAFFQMFDWVDEDISELEAIRMRNLSSPLQVLLQTIQKDKRLALIVVTLVFAILSYFYSRHRSSDDVL